MKLPITSLLLIPLVLVFGLAATGPTRSPKDTAKQGKDKSMVPMSALVPTIPPKPLAVVVHPPKPPWRVSASFTFDKATGATGYRVYFTSINGLWATAGDLGDTNTFTLTNINPYLPIYVQVSSLSGTNESVNKGQTIFLQVSPSSWIANDGQHFAMQAATNRVTTVEAESVLNGAKTTVFVSTNQPVITFVRPVQAKEFYIFTAR